MMSDLLAVSSAPWLSLGIALVMFGFAPGLLLAAILKLFATDDPRRKELQAELHAVPRWERPFWVFEQFEVALREGLFPELQWQFGRHIWHRSKIESGLESHRRWPESFEVPDDETKDVVRPGDLVKLMWSVRRFPGERMWVKVVSRDGDRLTGTLNNWAVFVHLRPGEVVEFHIDDIIDCILEDDEVGEVA